MRAMIILTTLNARYSHASLGLRYLLANLGAHQAHTRMIEFTIKTPMEQMCDELLSSQPRVIGLGV